MEFMQVLRRFFSIRGYPAVMRSDNGSQMVRAARKLREMVKGFDEDQLREFCAEKGIEWKFTTPASPHQNGYAEVLVKTCKGALKGASGEHVLAPLELYTYLLEIANLVNQRPIGRVPNDPGDGIYICPNDIGQHHKYRKGPSSKPKIPGIEWNSSKESLSPSGNDGREMCFPHFPRRKWCIERRNVRIDDVVTVTDENAVRGSWTMGRIADVFPGADGKERNVKVKTAKGVYSRPVTKIAVIYPAEGYD